MQTSPTLPDLGICSPAARTYAAYWGALPKDNLIPSRTSFDPADLPAILPGFAVHEFLSPNNILVRLCGSAVVERFGYEMTGKNYLSHFRAPRQPEVYEALSKVIDCPCGLLVHIRMFRESGITIDYEVLGFPFRNEQGIANLAIYHTETLKSHPKLAPRGDRRKDSMPLRRMYIDIGAGVPDWDYSREPGRFSV
jgi:hypothetical protein